MISRDLIIVQARMGSSRFPGKMLADLGGYSIIEWVLRRVIRARLPIATVLATTDQKCDDPLAELAKKLDIPCFRGSETDVLGRFAAAAKKFGGDAIIRVCADNPFVAPEEIDRLIGFYYEKECDYAFNHLDRLGSCYADGFGAEIFSNALLQKLAVNTRLSRYREHVTLFLWENQEDFRIEAVKAPLGLAYPGLRFDVDTPDDLLFLQALVCDGANLMSTAAEIIQINRRQLTNAEE